MAAASYMPVAHGTGVEAKSVIRCPNCGGSMMPTYDADVRHKVWHCIGCSKDIDPACDPIPDSAKSGSVSALGEGTMREVGMRSTELVSAVAATKVAADRLLLPGGDWVQNAAARVRALLTQIPAHERAVAEMKFEAERTVKALEVMGMAGIPDLPWRHSGGKKKKSKALPLEADGTLGRCATCGKEFASKYMYKLWNEKKICKGRKCERVVIDGDPTAAAGADPED